MRMYKSYKLWSLLFLFFFCTLLQSSFVKAINQNNKSIQEQDDTDEFIFFPDDALVKKACLGNQGHNCKKLRELFCCCGIERLTEARLKAAVKKKGAVAAAATDKDLNQIVHGFYSCKTEDAAWEDDEYFPLFYKVGAVINQNNLTAEEIVKEYARVLKFLKERQKKLQAL